MLPALQNKTESDYTSLRSASPEDLFACFDLDKLLLWYFLKATVIIVQHFVA